MPLSKQELQRLKKPFGKLIADTDVSEKTVRAETFRAKLVISVGDATTERLLSFRITPDVSVIDGHERRSKRQIPPQHGAREIRCTNAKGTLTMNAIRALQSAVNGRMPARVLVDGEEDILALPLFLLAPNGSVVLYGQPLEGLVAVRIDVEKKKEARTLLSELFGSSILKAVEKQTAT
jgi:GTP-dependent dephospho-CoA kinase